VAVTIFGIRNCDTIRRARAWLEARGVAYEFHDYKSAGIDRARLEAWCDALGWERVINRAGTTFRKLPEGQRTDLARDRAVELMLAQPSMIRRPVIDADGLLASGFDAGVWAALLQQGG
jgi:Spx/MgsR family transcriptional regulator